MSNPNGPASSGASDRADAIAAIAPTRLAIIGCGNPARSDDGAGVAVVQALRSQELHKHGVQLIDAGTAGMDVIFRVRGVPRVLIIDACRSGSEPGAIFRLSAREAMTPTEHGFTLHGLRWDHALYAGCKMFGDGFADHAVVILIEGLDFGFGFDLSAPVKGAVHRVATLLASEAAIDG